MYEPLQPIVCCLGQPVAGNPTQFMIERAFAAAGLDWRYLTLEVPAEQLADAVRGMRAMGFKGGIFASPHKVAVIQYLDKLSKTATSMGAVNCVNREGNHLVGHNTDGQGFVESLRTVCDPVGKNILLLGGGGVARAIGVAVAMAGAAAITVVNRSPARGQELIELLQQAGSSAQAANGNDSLAAKKVRVSEQIDLVVQATSIGAGASQGQVPIDVTTLKPHMVVADVTFNPPETALLQAAAQQGCTTLDGLGMLVNQSAIAFKIWTGVDPDTGVMREALEEYLEL